MKVYIKNLCFLPALIAGFGLIPAGRVTAQTFTNLYSFTALSGGLPDTNSDGAFPQASLILSGNTLYGMAKAGGSSRNGTVFAITTGDTAPTIAFSPLTNTETIFDFAQLGGTISEAGSVSFRIQEYNVGSADRYWNSSTWITNGNDPGVFLAANVSALNWTPAPGTLPGRGDEWFHWRETPEGWPVTLDAASDENSKRRQMSHRCLRGGAFFAQDLRAGTLLLASHRESDLKHHYPTSANLLPNQTTSCL